MELAWGELDVAEIPGEADNPKIVSWHETTLGGGDVDEVSWCSSFVNAMITRSGLVGTDSKAARSWLRWGTSCAPVMGCVCVLWRVRIEAWQGHVGFWVAEAGDSVYLLGGNQSNRVRVSRYPKDRVLDYRSPA